MAPIRVTVWSEGLDGSREPRAVATYPQDIHTYLARVLGQQADLAVRTACLSDSEHGLCQSLLDETDVLVYWSHLYDSQITEEEAERVVDAVLSGMGLLLLHSALWSKVSNLLLGRNANTGKYREVGERERVWVVDRSHPIVQGLAREYFEIEQDEMYGEPHGLPTPDELVFISWFQGGEVLRSGAVYHKGAGKVFYFSPGHEEFPVYAHPEVQKVLCNAIRYLRPLAAPPVFWQGEVGSIEPLD